MVVSTAGAAITLGCLVFYYKWENRRRDRIYANQEHREDSEFLDLTDRENHEFRVSWSSQFLDFLALTLTCFSMSYKPQTVFDSLFMSVK